MNDIMLINADKAVARILAALIRQRCFRRWGLYIMMFLGVQWSGVC